MAGGLPSSVRRCHFGWRADSNPSARILSPHRASLSALALAMPSGVAELNAAITSTTASHLRASRASGERVENS